MPSATIVTLSQRHRARLHPDQADQIRQLLLPFAEDLGDTISDLLYYIDRQTAGSNSWTFVMLSPSQNAAIVDYLLDHSKRPRQALRLWAYCFEHLNSDTGEIMLGRAEFAELLQAPASTVTKIMAELQARNAIITRRQPVRGLRGAGVVRYFMNPTVATHLAGKARDIAQAISPQPITAREPKTRQASLQLVINVNHDTKREKSRVSSSKNTASSRPKTAQ
jgi:hypothetical protein